MYHLIPVTLFFFSNHMASSSLLISSAGPSPKAQDGPVYNTPASRALVRKILAECLPPSFEPHDYQIEGTCPAMDGKDVLATMATGTGKTGFFIFLMLVIHAISQDPSPALGGITFPEDPTMIVVCPTKALQVDMVHIQFPSFHTIRH
jgi:ATP-dependent helicase YprA (DUF1998 family)